MSTSISYEGVGYEGGGFLKRNVVFAEAAVKAVKPAKYATPADAEIEKRERAMYRENLPAWLCKLLEA